ncbi:hypothetical protein, unlikely [Trypanosoma brucei gambiense DAL972]|uniref:Uncharacterized protein n=1 Tax=Trypanosoma brucei gambiense (strain MHOM/CI/86/DAL972) TaxID=679716 RepID=D0A353_TRYB9|nr:hypothetical protein, unlikely [Trypanosoma brucei gambiense DAL972]CBH15697.1 hypothetical protein, unlikely [Trypanosoma brucei gambiense DAL972]|eukprot:XP_011777961.1 hypothetical protein, unlikely [Trypanosoma brucei gambiense DAL972]
MGARDEAERSTTYRTFAPVKRRQKNIQIASGEGLFANYRTANKKGPTLTQEESGRSRSSTERLWRFYDWMTRQVDESEVQFKESDQGVAPHLRNRTKGTMTHTLSHARGGSHRAHTVERHWPPNVLQRRTSTGNAVQL